MQRNEDRTECLKVREDDEDETEVSAESPDETRIRTGKATPEEVKQ